MKRHFIGATYDLTQANMNGLIEQLEEARAEVERLKSEQAEFIRETEAEIQMHLRDVAERDRLLAEAREMAEKWSVWCAQDSQGETCTCLPHRFLARMKEVGL